ncbi:MAG: glycosyltransferase [Hamadaea sp.]|nr:glycosyltransferase [Hamadaea sp.]
MTEDSPAPAVRRLPGTPLRARVRNVLRAVKRRSRRARPLPAWADRRTESDRLTVRSGRLAIVVDTVGELLRLASAPASEPVTGIDLTVRSWVRPWPQWIGRTPPIPGLLRQEMSLPDGDGPAALGWTVAQPIASRQLLMAALSVLSPIRPLPATLTADVYVDGDRPAWLPIGPAYHAAEARRPDGGPLPAYDLVVRGETEGLVLVDAAGAHPRGRQETSVTLPRAELRMSAADDGWTWQVGRPGRADVVVAGRAGEALDERQTAALAQVGLATLTGDPAPGRIGAGVLAQLAMTGLVLSAPRLPLEIRAHLHEELVGCLTDVPGDRDPLDREVHGVVQRRAALRHHASALGLRAVAAERHPTSSRLPGVSAILVSRRPDRALAAAAALAGQTYPELELVVGLHGHQPTPAQVKQLEALPVPVRLASFPAATGFGEVLAETTRLASGSLVTKVDDDDHYGPEHIWDLVLARLHSGATVVGKGAEFVYLEPFDTTVRRRMGGELYTDVVAGGTMMISRGDLDEVGGWRPVSRSVDRALLDRVLAAGGLVYRTHGFGFLYTRHDDGHTWDPGVEYFLHDPARRWAGRPPYREFAAGRPSARESAA